MANPRIQDPLAVAVSNVMKDSHGWADGAAKDLVKSPSTIVKDIHYHLRIGWHDAENLYGKMFAESSLERINIMAKLLGIDVNSTYIPV